MSAATKVVSDHDIPRAIIGAWVSPPHREGWCSIFFWCAPCRHWHEHGLPAENWGEPRADRVSHCPHMDRYSLELHYHIPPGILRAFRSGRRPRPFIMSAGPDGRWGIESHLRSVPLQSVVGNPQWALRKRSSSDSKTASRSAVSRR